MIEELKKRCSLLQGQQNALQSELKETETFIETEKAAIALLERALIVLKKLVDRATQEDLEKIQEFATNGMKKVLYDQDIECRISATSKTGAAKVRIFGKEGDVEGPFLRTFGGGVWNTVSFVLRLIFILRFGMRRVIFLDESFSKISEEYQPYMSELVQSLSKQLGFKVLLITHQPSFAEHADKVYQAKSVKGKLVLEEIEK